MQFVVHQVGLAQELFGGLRALFVRNPLRRVQETQLASCGRLSIAVGIGPSTCAIEVTVGHQAAPQFGNPLIAQANVTGGQRSATEATQDQSLSIATVLIANDFTASSQ